MLDIDTLDYQSTAVECKDETQAVRISIGNNLPAYYYVTVEMAGGYCTSDGKKYITFNLLNNDIGFCDIIEIESNVECLSPCNQDMDNIVPIKRMIVIASVHVPKSVYIDLTKPDLPDRFVIKLKKYHLPDAMRRLIIRNFPIKDGNFTYMAGMLTYKTE
jgi:hypothetical protein